MNGWRACARENEVRIASASGRWTPALEGHAAVCERCHDVRTVTRALASPIRHAPVLVDPAVLWARARATAQVRAMARVDRVLTLSQIGVAIVAIAGIAVAARVLDLPIDAGGTDMNTIVMGAGVMLTIVTAFVVRWARP